MRRFFSLLLVAIILSSCFGSQTAKRYFQLQLGNDIFPVNNTLAMIIMINSVRIKPLYDDFRIIYRISPYEINYYSYDFWAKKPDKLILDSIVDYFSRSKMFMRVDEKLSSPEPDLYMKVKLNSIEEVDIGNTWYARLSLDFEIQNFKSSQVILNYNFDRKKKLPSRKVFHLPRAISRILQEELSKVLKKLVKKLHQAKTDQGPNPRK
jgi:ABC-type uncharacterized transport system auxiliary subunit